jgi:hypothetical protein
MTYPIPAFDPLGLPLPSYYLQALAYLTLTLHFVAMQFTVGGAILLLWSYRRESGIARFFGTGLPLGFSYLVTFGIPPLLFVQVMYGQFFYSSSVLIGAYWISVIPLIIIGYGASYFHRMSRDSRPRYQATLISTSVVALLCVGFIYVNNLTLSLRPERWLAHYAAHPSGGALNLSEPTLFSRVALFLCPALGAAGLSLVLRAAYLRGRNAIEAAAVSHRIGVRAMTLAAILVTGATIGLGLTLPKPVRAALLEPGSLSALAAAGALLGMSALVISWRAENRKGMALPVLAAHLYVGAIACLVVLRDFVRQLYLRPFFQLDAAPVVPQWGMAIMFTATLVAGLAFLFVLTRQMVKGLIAADKVSQTG